MNTNYLIQRKKFNLFYKVLLNKKSLKKSIRHVFKKFPYIDQILSCVIFYLDHFQVHSVYLKKLIDQVEFLFSENCIV